MAVKTLQLSTSQVAGLLTTQVAGVTAVQISSATTITDFATLANAIVDDQQIIKLAKGPSAATIQPAVIFTGTTTANTATITSFVLTTPTTATIASIRPGMTIVGPGIAPGTRVLSAVTTTITLDTAVYAAVTTQTFAAVGARLSGGMNGFLLNIPNRGQLLIQQGDAVALDNLGFPYLVPANSINFNGGGSASGAPFLLK